MRVAMVSEHASPMSAVGTSDAGGQNVHVDALSRALGARGHQVTVYTRRDSGVQPRSVMWAPGVEVVHVDAGPATYVARDEMLPYMAEFGDQLGRALQHRPADVLHTHFWMSGVAALAAQKSVDVPMVCTFHALGSVKRRHQGDADTSPPSRQGHESELVQTADRLTASCEDERRELLALGARPDAIDLVPSGVDTATFRPDGAASPRSRAHRLLALGRLVERKGVEDAVRALALIDNAELVVAGGPPAEDLHDDADAQRIVALARSLDVAHRLRLLGQVPRTELPALIRSADVVVCLPWYEPFGIVPLEAMACGVPVVGSAVGGLLDTVEDGRTGLLVNPREPQQAAKCLEMLLDDRALAAEFGRQGVARVAKNYTWPRVAERTERTYLRAIGTR